MTNLIEPDASLSGNELSGSGVGTRVTADQYASDIKFLQNKVQDIYSGSKLAKPLVLAPGGFFDSDWFSQFVDKAPQSVQVLTHHIYNLGPGMLTLRFFYMSTFLPFIF